MAKAKAAAERAIELDDSLAEAHTSLAAVHHRHEGDVGAAERAFRRAVDLNPGYATAHQWYSILLAEEGRDEEATRHAQQAVTLDPLSGTMHQTAGLVHYYGRRYERAAVEARRALELSPHLPLAREILARALLADGKPEASIQVCEQAPSSDSAEMLAVKSLAYLRTGDRARADAILEQLLARRPLPTNVLARWYAAAGNREAAAAMLERTSTGGPGLQQFKADPAFDGLRSDPRFADLLRRATRR